MLGSKELLILQSKNLNIETDLVENKDRKPGNLNRNCLKQGQKTRFVENKDGKPGNGKSI